MDETMNEAEKKQGFPKKLIAIIVVAILVIGGSVAAYVMLNLSDKEKYFLAEKESMDFIVDKVEERYQPELDWLEQAEENPTESAVELSAEYNDPTAIGIGGITPQEIINNATLTFTSQTDMEKKQIASEIKGSFGDMEVDDIHFYLTDEKVMVGLPFLKEILQVKSDDIGNLLHEADPVTFTGEENPDFNTLFEGNVLSEEDEAYLNKEYVEMIYDKLSDSAFKASDETVKVKGDSIDTEKIALHLSEKEVKDILATTFEKMQKDDRLKEIILKQFEMQQFGMSANLMQDEFDDFTAELDTALEKAQDGLDDFQIPDGLTSTIWTKDKFIVKRDFSVELGPSKDELASLSINGTQSLEDASQTFDYDLGFADEYDEGTMTVTGDLSTNDDKASDSIKLSIEDTEIAYDGKSTLKDGKRDFERVFSIDDAYSGGGKLIWSGKANYEKDQMNAEHDLSIDAPAMGITQDMFALHIKNSGKTIKGVEMPKKEDNIKDLGSMNIKELMDYFEADVTPKAQQWIIGLMGAGAMGF